MAEHSLKSGWTRVHFGDVVKFYKDRSVDPAADGIERYVAIEHIEPEDLRIRSWGLVEDGTTFTQRFKPGQTLFVKRRAYQRKVAVADFAGVCSGDIYVLEPKGDRLWPELLPFLCQTDAFFAHAVNTSAGSLSPRTNWKQLAEYEFALPPLAEQRRIARVLAANDKLTQELCQTTETLFKLRQAVQENLLLPVQNQENIPRVRIDTIAKVNPSDPALPENAPFVPMDAIQEWNRNLTEFETRGSRGGIRAKSGDILMARITPCLENGKTAQVPNTVDRCGGSTELIVLRPKKGFTSDYVYWVATAPCVRHRAIGLMIGSTGRQRVSARDIASIRIPLTPQDKRLETVELLNKLEIEHGLLKERIEICKVLQKQLFFDLLKG